MTNQTKKSDESRSRSLHSLGVLCGLAAGAWLGAAEAPTKLVTAGFSPFLISLMMVAGVFVARWTLPMALKGTGYILKDFQEKPHLLVWAILAGMLWSVANTLTVFAIRDVGLSIAFPLWNTNSLVGLFWGWLMFNELRGATIGQKSKVLGGAGSIIIGAYILAYATSQHSGVPPQKAAAGILAALGAGLLWGTMYIPYRKAYISGMNPLSFVTMFTVGELLTVGTLAAIFHGGLGPLAADIQKAQTAIFWLFLGGFFWVIGDLFQQYAAKYIGIGRGVPLSNTNQIWGLAWGVFVFGELSGQGPTTIALVVSGSLVMVAGAIAISKAEASEEEKDSWRIAMQRECDLYQLDPAQLEAALQGEDSIQVEQSGRPLWEYVVGLVAIAIFVGLAWIARGQDIAINYLWMTGLLVGTLAFLGAGGWLLWKRTRFS